ncbi:hypothetical protein ACFU53_38790 [Streptomyces sp. NPDC057474]|uniref:hypothetical protein n=1 Tax=Streptomyces sp. NPDC057474 TaxID=3346144 RepID=UPI0036C8E4E4
MPRGRHRHSPPLHRLLPPTAIAGVSLVCALGPWLFSEPAVLRVTAAVAAATAAVGAAVMRRWDVEAGKRVADLTRARASDEWRHEEKAAELETDLDESRELRTKLEHKLRAKRTELANLRNEHAALLRRYATAETERASALEGRRLLEIEATVPEGARALPAAGADADAGADEGDEATAAAQASQVPPQGVPAPGAPWASWEAASRAAAEAAKGKAVAASASASASASADAGVDASAEGDAEVEADEEGSGARKPVPAVFSPAGSSLFLRANSALDRIITQRRSARGSGAAGAETEAGAGAGAETKAEAEAEVGAGVPVASDGAAAAGADVVVEAVAEDAAVAESAAVSGADGEFVAAVDSEDGSEIASVSETASGAGFGSETAFAVEGAVESEAGRGVEGEAGAEVDARADARADADAEPEVAGTEEEHASEPSETERESVDDSVDVDVQADESVEATVAKSAPAESAAETAEGRGPKDGSPKGPSPKGDPDGPTDGGTRQGRSAEAEDEPVPVLTVEEDDAAGRSVAVRGHERAAAEPVPAVFAPARSTRSARAEEPTGVGELTRVEPSGRVGHVGNLGHVAQAEQVAPSALPALPALPPAGHFTVPTAVAVVPAAPQRRAAVEGGFDFFGTEKGADALEAVQNEDLADVVGQEALALHKAESESQFKRADEASRGVGQVIDLTAHDETEQIDVQGLRTAAS